MADNVEEILSINIENLREKQFNTLKSHIVKKLVEVAKFVNDNDDFDAKEVSEKFMFYSPAGDGYGCDNHCINVGFGDNKETKELDLCDALDLLMKIKTDDPGYFERNVKD